MIAITADRTKTSSAPTRKPTAQRLTSTWSSPERGGGGAVARARNAFGDVRHVRRLDRRRQDPSVPRRGSGTIGPARRWPLASIPKQRSATPNEDQANTVPTWLTGAQPTRSRPTRARPSISRSPKTAFFPLQRLDWIRKRQFERGRPRRHLSNEIACSRT